MSENMTEIRWHGRGGQGAKTAALLLGEAVVSSGKYVQAFPEYGPERMGAPVAAYNRISANEILIHSPIINPDIVLVLDETLIDSIDVTKGLDENKGILIVNTPFSKEEIQKKLTWKGKLVVIDATKISLETIGKPIPNTPMMGALIAVSDFLSLDDFINDTKKKLEKKFKNKPGVIEGNINAIKRAYEEVKKQ